MRTLTYAGVDFSEFKCWWDGSQVFRKPNKIINRYQIPYRNGDLIRSTEAFENVEISFNCFIKEDYEENYSNLVNYLNSFNSYQRLETSAEPSIYRMALLHAVIEPETGQFLKDGRFTITFDCMPQEWLKSGENEMSIDMQTTTYTDPVEVDIEYDDALVDNAVLTLSPVQDLNGQAYPWIDRVGRNKLNLVNMAKTETFCGITFNLTDEGKIYMTGTATDTMNWFPFTSIETIPNGIWKISGLPSNMTFGDYGFSTIDSDQHITEHYENNSEVTDTIINFGVWVYEGVTLNNVELKPMIRESTDTSDVWQPYEHTTNICPIYPANGKNLWEYSAEEFTRYKTYAVSLLAGTYTVSAVVTSSDTDSTTCRIGFFNAGGTSISAVQIGRNSRKSVTVSLDQECASIYLYASDTANHSTGDTATWADMMIELGSVATSYVPYQSVAVNQHGRNLLNLTATQKTSVGITFENDNGIVTANGTATGLANISLCGSDGVKLEAFTTYILSGCPSGGGDNTYQIDLRVSNAITTIYKGVVDRGSGITFTTDEAVTVYPFAFVRSGYTADNLTFKPMIRLASDTDDTFEPYQSNTYTTDLEQFVYGGTVDLVTGVLTVGWKLVDLGSLTWTYNGARTRFETTLSDAKPTASNTQVTSAISSGYRAVAASAVQTTDEAFGITNISALLLHDDRFTTVADFVTAVTGQTICYELASPVNYYLSAQDIALLQGKNYFTSEQPLSVTITEGTTLTNPSYMKARPIIKLNNTGTGTVKLNGDVVVRVTEAPSNVPIYIDCENMNCYSYDSDGNVVNENGNVTLPEGYIEMEKGNNRFTATGQLEPTMIPRWWRL